jgi:hypothetical protein
MNLVVDSRKTLDFGDKKEDYALSVILKEQLHYQCGSATLIDLSLTSFPKNIGINIKTGHNFTVLCTSVTSWIIIRKLKQ